MNIGRWEWAIGEVIVLPLLFWELYRLRRSQRLDRAKAASAAAEQATQSPDPAPVNQITVQRH